MNRVPEIFLSEVFGELRIIEEKPCRSSGSGEGIRGER